MERIIFFHKPEEPNGYLSNWYLSDFKINGINYLSMEQYMMYQKAVLFGDSDTAKEILRTKDVAKVKQLGRSVKNYNDIYWNGMRQVIVYQGLLEKFGQNKELKENLIGTNDSILAECAVNDKIWGIGISMKDDRRFNMYEWQGKNLLGFTLMAVRDKLK